MNKFLLESLTDSIQAVKECQMFDAPCPALRLLKDAENALHGAAKIIVALQPKAEHGPSHALTNHAWAEHKRKLADDWRALANSWEQVRDNARTRTEKADAEKQMQHARLMAEAQDAAAAELERGS